MNAEPQQSLFRAEALDAKRSRIEGEIVLTQPLRVQGLTLFIFAMIAAAATWVSLGQYARTETARGILVTDTASAKVMAIRLGVVTDLKVREGDMVRAGQHIAAIRVEAANEKGGSAIQQNLDAIEAQSQLTHRQVLLSKERARSEQARLTATLEGIRQQRADVFSQIALQRQVVASAKDLFERIQTIVEKGFVSRIEVERRRQAYLTAKQELAKLQQQITALGAEEGRASAELQRITADRGSEIASALTSAQALEQQRAQLESERAYSIRAPISGRVTALQTAPGRPVDVSVPLLVIIPEGSKLHADVYAPARAIGFVRPGQEVRLLYDAFPYQRFGSFSGRVTTVSRIAMAPGEISAPLKIEEPVYRIEVTPDRQVVEAFGQESLLQPGMSLTANLVLDRRTFLDWLLEPLNAVLRRNQ